MKVLSFSSIYFLINSRPPSLQEKIVNVLYFSSKQEPYLHREMIGILSFVILS